MGREVAQPLEDGESEIRRVDLEGEALADQSGKVRLVLQGIDAGDDAAGAVAEDEHGEPRLPRLRQIHKSIHVAQIVPELLEVVTLAVRLAPAVQVQRVHREAAGHELVGRPEIMTAVGIETVDDHDHAAGLAFWTIAFWTIAFWTIAFRTPGPDENLETLRPFDSFFFHRH